MNQAKEQSDGSSAAVVSLSALATFQTAKLWLAVFSCVLLVYIIPALKNRIMGGSTTAAPTIDSSPVPKKPALPLRQLVAERHETFLRILASMFAILVAHRDRYHYFIYLVSYLGVLMFKNINPFSPNSLKLSNQSLSVVILVDPVTTGTLILT